MQNTKPKKKKKFKLSKEGLIQKREQVKLMRAHPNYKNRDFAYQKSPEFSKLIAESNKRRWAEGRMKDPFEEDFEVVVKERKNDYCGVLEEKDFKEMRNG